jgi:CTP synthase (UTP-ammonia lyase)
VSNYNVALVGDFNVSVIAHNAVPQALRLTGIDITPVWFHTSAISDPESQFADFDGIWCVPASPYANTEGALSAIRYARERGRPFLGTCGGFQHALLEYARNVCGLHQAANAETDPGAALRLIAPLACSLIEKSDDMLLTDGLLGQAYGQSRITEGYHCSYGLNRDYEALLFSGDLRVTARDLAGEVRGVELSGHPFFAATLFQPERRALRGETPPLVAAFVSALAA